MKCELALNFLSNSKHIVLVYIELNIYWATNLELNKNTIKVKIKLITIANGMIEFQNFFGMTFKAIVNMTSK